MDLVPAGENPIDRRERIVDRVAQRVGWHPERNVSRRRRRVSRDWDEGTAEWIEHAIELHAHLVGERPAGVVIGRSRRSPRIGNVVWMHLRLEHIDDVRAERLRGSHDQRIHRITFSANGKWSSGAMYDDAGLDQSVGEFRGREKVALVGGDDVSARVALLATS